MEDKNIPVELTDEQADEVDGGFLLLGNVGVGLGKGQAFDPDYCPQSPDHKHCYRTVVGVKSCLFCGGRPTNQ